MTILKMPNQPVKKDEHGVDRFVPNRIVSYLLEAGSLDMNHLGRVGHMFSDEEHAQFAQLIGYSVSGWGGLSYVSEDKDYSVFVDQQTQDKIARLRAAYEDEDDDNTIEKDDDDG